MACINSHPLRVPSPKHADPLGEEPCAHAVQRCSAAPDFAGCSAGEHDTSGFTCGQTQRCLMLCCCLVCTELGVSLLLSRDGSRYSRKAEQLALLPACGKLSRAAFMPLLKSQWSSLLPVQAKGHWADFTAAALFHPNGKFRTRGLW